VALIAGGGSVWILLEILTIVIEPFFMKTLYQYDSEMGFRVKPYAQGTNCFGFCDRDHSLNKDKGVYRILFVGDSFGWAGGPDGNYTALLAGEFRSRNPDVKVEVLNSGYPMTHTAEQLPMLRRYGLQYHPDLVFLGFFAGNDFLDADSARKRIPFFDMFMDIDKKDEHVVFGHPVVLKSRILYLCRYYWAVWTKCTPSGRADTRKIGAAGPESEGTFTEDAYLHVEKTRLDFCKIASQEEGRYNDRIHTILQAIGQMRDELRGRGIDFVVGIYPDEFQVRGKLREDLKLKYGLNLDEYDIKIPQKILSRFLEKEQIPYVDLLEGFEKEATEKDLYQLRDTHWNEAGNRLAADMIYGWIRTRIRTKIAG